MRFSGSAYLVGAIAGIGLTASAVPVQAADIVLGLSFGKTGLYSTINKTTEIAVDIAAAEINAAGGINGKSYGVHGPEGKRTVLLTPFLYSK